MIKFLKYFSVILVFTLSIIILNNYFKINLNNCEELSVSNKYLNHIISDHNINESHLDLPDIKFNHQNFTEKKSSKEFINTFQEINYFLSISTFSIQTDPYKKISYAENFFYTDGFKSSCFKPPKYSA